MNAITNMRPLRRVDSRQCQCCGAVYGRCQHTEGKVCEDVIWLSKTNTSKYGRKRELWEPHEDDILRSYVTETKLHYGKIADLMNKTRSACIGRANRLGLVRADHG